MQKYWDSQAAPVCVMQKTHGEEPSSWFISVIFQCMKKGLRPNGYFPLTRQPRVKRCIKCPKDGLRALVSDKIFLFGR